MPAVVVVAVAHAFVVGFLVFVAFIVGKGEEIRKRWRGRLVLDVGVGLVFHDSA